VGKRRRGEHQHDQLDKANRPDLKTGAKEERSDLTGVNGGAVVRLTGNVALAGHGKAKRGGQRLRAFKVDSQRRNGEELGMEDL
jgi:hypothetical protein